MYLSFLFKEALTVNKRIGIGIPFKAFSSDSMLETLKKAPSMPEGSLEHIFLGSNRAEGAVRVGAP